MSFFTLDGELQLGGRVMQRNASDVASLVLKIHSEKSEGLNEVKS